MKIKSLLAFGIFLLSLSSVATIEIVEPTTEDRKLHEFSFDTTKTFLPKKSTDTIAYTIKTSEHKPEHPFFQILSMSTETPTKPVVEFTFNDEKLPKTFYETRSAAETFKITTHFDHLSIAPNLAILPGRKRIDLELGFHSGDTARDASDKVTAAFFVDHTAPAARPKDESVSAADQSFIVKVGSIPSDVRYLVLAYGPETADTANEKLTESQFITEEARNKLKFKLCYQAIDIASSLTLGTYAFNGSNAKGSFRCADPIRNDVPYITAVGFADTAGNLIMSETTHHNITPRMLSGVFDPNSPNCVAASTSSNDSYLFWFLLFLIAMVGVWRSHKVILPVCILAILISNMAHAQETYDPQTGALVTEPKYGFVEIMYGFFPHPTLKSKQVTYRRLFEPGALSLSDGPSALMVGTQFNFWRTGIWDIGPLLRTGMGIQNGNPFFTAGGATQFSTADTLNLFMIPTQLGLGVNLHFLHRFLSFNGRVGTQWTLFNQTFESKPDGGVWSGNLASFFELNVKLNLDWIEAWAAWGLFDSWGIQNTYLSFHTLYLRNLSGGQLIFDSSSKSNTLMQNLGWFAGITFEI